MEEIERAGARLVAVSYDSVETLKRFARQRNITYPLLSDPESRTITDYGILNKEANNSRLKGIPYPGTFIVDQEGVIEAKLFYEGYKDRHQSADILEALGGD